ncbi:MAG: response regulator transcription factor [Myxococcales bacterium]|nr:response regulator transcription factor [Myxococcales bacterium]
MKIAEDHPALLDIDMPEVDGLQLAAPDVDVVFVTAHSEHAVAAFDLAALDYLLKPVREARLREVIRRVRERRGRADPVSLAAALRTLLPVTPPVPRITATEGSTARVFDAREIDRFSAANRYVRFVVDGHEQLLDDSLNTLEKRLADHDFVRVHRAELINLRFVVALRRIGGSAEVELASGARVQVSRRLLPEFERRLGARP